MVKEDTLGRWIKSGLFALGVDEKFTVHSTRHASTLKAYVKGVNIGEIKRVAKWSKNSRVFVDYYNRPIVLREDTFATTVLLPAT